MLIGIFTAAWILVLLGAALIFEYIVPLAIFHSFLDSIVKGILAIILVAVWLVLFVAMRNLMIRTQLRLVKKVSV
jgi:hypothetical protein